MQLESFGDLSAAETALIAHLRGHKPGHCEIAPDLPPEDAGPDVQIRASLLRALILQQIEGIPLPERGLRLAGAYIRGDGPPEAETRGLDLEGCDLRRDLALFDCRIPDLILLRSANLRNLYLDGTYLAGELKADRLRVEGGVFLRKITAQGEIRLLGARIGGDPDCEDAQLNATGKALNAQGSHIRGGWFWRGGASSLGALDFTAAEIGRINDAPACWPEEILLNRCRYGAFTGHGVSGAARLDWLARMAPQKYGKDFWPQPYEECARALREAGQGTEARMVLIEKERLQRAARQARLRREEAGAEGTRRLDLRLRRWGYGVSDWLLKWTVAYGRRPLQATVPLLFLLFIGALVFGAAGWMGQIKPNQPRILTSALWTDCAAHPQGQLACFRAAAPSYPGFAPLVYSADTLLPVVNLEVQGNWVPDDRQWPFGAFARRYLWVQILAGWGLTLLAVAGFSGLIKTDNTR